LIAFLPPKQLPPAVQAGIIARVDVAFISPNGVTADGLEDKKGISPDQEADRFGDFFSTLKFVFNHPL
jgi:hypothetical protein